MSSQGANSTILNNGYVYDPLSIRDSSDITRAIRERIVFYESSTISQIVRTTENPWIKYGNNFRLSYLKGKYTCGDCLGNVYGLNGVGS